MKGIKVKSLLYLSIAAGLLIYAIPQLEMGQGLTTSSIFGIVWIGMALVIIAAHLHQIIGVDEETKKELLRIKKFRNWQMEQILTGKSKMMQVRK